MKTGFTGAVAKRFLNSKLTPLLIGASLVAGVGGLMTTPREEEPQIQVPMIDVAVGLPGASPREVERRIAEPLERAIWEIPGLDYVYSVSQQDGALITARFDVGTDPDVALTRLWGKLLARADRSPPGATPPLVTVHGINEVPILTLTLSGGSDAGDGYLLRQQAAELAQALKRTPDVAETWVIGGAPREVAITFDAQQLAARDLSAAAVLRVLGAANAELPAGSIVEGNQTLNVRVGSLLRDVEQVRSVVVGVVDDRAILLRDVARVTDGPAEPDNYVGFLPRAGRAEDFEPAVTIAIAKREGTNAAAIAHETMALVEELRGDLIADDVRITVTRDYGETATEKSQELLLHIVLATVGVGLLVWLALGWREAAVVLVAVPVTLALTLLMYRLFGYTLNRITLFALVFAIGILVDDAIVVVENIARHFKLWPDDATRAAISGVDEVGNPTILATFAVIAAILPMAFVSGLMGPYMRPIPVGASVAMMLSLAVAFIVTPYMAIRLLKGHGHGADDPMGEGESAHGDKALRQAERALQKEFARQDESAHQDESRHEDVLPSGRLATWYRGVLQGLIANRGRRLAVYGGMVFLLALAVLLVPAKLVTIKMLPFDNKSEFQIIVDMPEGTSLERTAEVAQVLALVVARDEAVSHVQTYAGVAAPFNFNGLVRHYFLRRGPTVADVQVNLLPKDERSEQSHDIALRLRPAIDSVARRFGAAVKVAEIPPGPPVQSTLVAEIYGPTHDEQIDAARRVRQVLLDTDGVVDVDWSASASHAQVRAAVAQAEAMRVGTSPQDIARTLAASLGGATVGMLHDENAADPVLIRARTADSTMASIHDLGGMPLSTAVGSRRLGTLARIDTVAAPGPIFHKNLKRVVYVTADVAGRLESPAYAMIEMGPALDELGGEVASGFNVYWTGAPSHAEGTYMVWDGEWDITLDVFRDLGIAFAAVLLLIYVLVVAWFQSFAVPLVIMAPIALTLIGILPAHAMTGAFFTATSMIGMIALAGIIVRNSILLVDFVNVGLDAGKSVAEAVVESGLVRARPIILTAGAVVIGGLVMVSDPIFQGLGIALISGAVVSTLLTLIVVPLLFFELQRGRLGPRP